MLLVPSAVHSALAAVLIEMLRLPHFLQEQMTDLRYHLALALRHHCCWRALMTDVLSRLFLCLTDLKWLRVLIEGHSKRHLCLTIDRRDWLGLTQRPSAQRQTPLISLPMHPQSQAMYNSGGGLLIQGVKLTCLSRPLYHFFAFKSAVRAPRERLDDNERISARNSL